MTGQTIAALRISLGLDASGVEQGVKQADKATSGFVKNVQGKFSNLGANLKTGVAQGFGLAGGLGIANRVGSAISGTIDQIGNSIELSSDKAEAASKVNVLFGESAGLIEEKSKSAAEAVGLSSGAYLTAAGDLGNLITNFGITGDKAADMSNDMIQLAADMGSFNNASTKEVTEAMGAAFRGEMEPIRRFGVMLDVASVKAKAMEMGLIGIGEELTPAARLQASYALILEQTSAAQGDFARTADGYANAQRIAAAKQEEAWTKVGDALMPIAAEIMPLVADATVLVAEGLASIIGVAKGVIDAIRPMFDWVGKLAGGIGGAGGLTDVLKPAAGAVIAFGAAVAGLKLTGLFGPVKALTGGLLRMIGVLGPAATTVGSATGGAQATAHEAAATGPGMVRSMMTKIGAMAIPGAAAGTTVGTAIGAAVTAGAILGLAGLGALALDEIRKQLQANVSEPLTDALFGEGAHARHAAEGYAQQVNEGLAQGLDLEASKERGRIYVENLFGASFLPGAAAAYARTTGTALGEAGAHFDEFAATTGAALGDAGSHFDEFAATSGAAGANGARAFGDGIATFDTSIPVNQFLDRLGADMARGRDALLEPFRALGAGIPGAIGRGMQSKANVLIDGAEALRDILENGTSPRDRAMLAIGEDYIKLVRQGMDSQKDGAKQTAQEVAIGAINTIEDAGLTGAKGQRGLKAIGIYFDELLASGMTGPQALAALDAAGVSASSEALSGVRSKYPQFFNTGVNAADEVHDGFTSKPWNEWGANVGAAWGRGVARGIAGKRGAIINAMPRGALEGTSPPREGPLKDIDKWGFNVGSAWVTSFLGSLKDGARQLSGALSGYQVGVRGPTMQPAYASASPTVSPAVSGAVAGGHGGVCNHISINGPVYGGPAGIDELTRQIEHRLRLTTRGGGRLIG